MVPFVNYTIQHMFLLSKKKNWKKIVKWQVFLKIVAIWQFFQVKTWTYIPEALFSTMSLIFSSLPMLVAPSSKWYSVMPVEETSSSMPTRWGLSESRLTPRPAIHKITHNKIKLSHIWDRRSNLRGNWQFATCKALCRWWWAGASHCEF